VLKFSTTNDPDVLFSTRQGYLVSTGDASGTTVTDVGHVFGRFGEGNGNYPGVAQPFYWGTSVVGNKPTINISLFPNTDGSTGGLDSPSKEIVIEGMADTWVDVSSFNMPTQPDAPLNPNSALALGACIFGALSVASSLC